MADPWFITSAIFNAIFVVVLLIAIAFIIYLAVKVNSIKSGINDAWDSFRKGYISAIIQTCKKASYRYEGKLVPFTTTEYNPQNASALLEYSYNVTASNCINLTMLPPKGFDVHIRLKGKNPVNNIPSIIAYFFYSRTYKMAAIVFTGTWYLSQFASDINFPLVAPTALNNYREGVKIHQGFYSVYSSVRTKLWNTVWSEYGPITDQLVISGHSLGGALSTICAYDFAGAAPSLYHYSFAAPVSGNPEYANRFNEIVPLSWRVANSADIVTVLPPPILLAREPTITCAELEEDEADGIVEEGSPECIEGLVWKKQLYQHCGTTTKTYTFNKNIGSARDNHIKAYSEVIMGTTWPATS